MATSFKIDAQQHPLPLGDGDRAARLHGERRSFAAGGNPYGTSYSSGHQVTGPDASALDVARYQGQRLASYATVIAEARSRGPFAVRRPSPETFHGATLTGTAAEVRRRR